MSERPTRPRFRVWLTDDTEHVVEVLHGDQLRAELEARKQGIPTDPSQVPQHTTDLWCWAALQRTGATSLPWQEFRPLIHTVGKVADHEPGPDQPVDPTTQDQATTGP